MAVESQAPVKSAVEDSRASVIENEIPTYRAIHPLAVVSLFFGLASLLSFASYNFLVASVLAIVAGAWALLKIGRFPDLYTGQQLARAGLALAVICAVSSVTIDVTRRYIVHRDASAFVNEYIDALNSRRLADAMWYRLPPTERRGTTPEEAVRIFREQYTDPGANERMFGAIRLLNGRLAKEDGHVELIKLEQSGWDALTPYGIGLLKVVLNKPTGTVTTEDQYARVYVKKTLDVKAARRPWFVEDVGYPYKPNSFTLPEKAVDDGHGHNKSAGGGHQH